MILYQNAVFSAFYIFTSKTFSFLTAQLIVNLVDMNDNQPTFPLSQYIVQGIAETVAVGTDIIQGTRFSITRRVTEIQYIWKSF